MKYVGFAIVSMIALVLTLPACFYCTDGGGPPARIAPVYAAWLSHYEQHEQLTFVGNGGEEMEVTVTYQSFMAPAFVGDECPDGLDEIIAVELFGADTTQKLAGLRLEPNVFYINTPYVPDYRQDSVSLPIGRDFGLSVGAYLVRDSGVQGRLVWQFLYYESEIDEANLSAKFSKFSRDGRPLYSIDIACNGTAGCDSFFMQEMRFEQPYGLVAFRDSTGEWELVR